MKNLIPFYVLLLAVILLTNCQKSNTTAELLPNLNGVWELEGVSNGNATGTTTPVLRMAETWTINGSELEVTLSTNVNYTRIASGNHELKIVDDSDDNQFLQIDDTILGEIDLNANELKINAGRKPNEFISHAAKYFFKKNE